jgi:spore coat polysaccharide biosynthesis predicted glycosyltransferase SpsG
MFALHIEASHQRGMGHLYRTLALQTEMQRHAIPSMIYVNEDPAAVDVLLSRGAGHRVVDKQAAQWQAACIEADAIRLWIDDCLDTDMRHAEAVARTGVPRATFDDRGPGAALADLNVMALCFDPAEALGGRRVLRGLDYLVLDAAIARYRRERTRVERIVVSMGGADTYGLTIHVVRLLKRRGRKATIVLGPAFRHERELDEQLTDAFEIRRGVPQLAPEMARHDLAITSGGMTCFEAAAAGLPTLIVAAEPWETAAALELQRLGAARYLGFRQEIDESALDMQLPLEAMSRAGMSNVGTTGAERVVSELLRL